MILSVNTLSCIHRRFHCCCKAKCWTRPTCLGGVIIFGLFLFQGVQPLLGLFAEYLQQVNTLDRRSRESLAIRESQAPSPQPRDTLSNNGEFRIAARVLHDSLAFQIA